MTTVVLSPPPGLANAPVPLSASTKSVRMGVSIDSAKETTLGTDSDSPTSSAVDLVSLGHGHDVQLDREPEAEREDDDREKQMENAPEFVASISIDSVADAAVDVRPCNKRRRVAFECADIVEFEPTVYTTSITSGGVPVGLSLNERSRSRRRLDSFEMERADERVGRQNYMEEGYLDPQEREMILNNAGCDEPVIASVEAEVNAIIQHRRESNDIDYSFMYVVEDEDEEEDVEDDEAEAEDEEAEEEEKQVDVLSTMTDVQLDAREELQDASEKERENIGEDDPVTTRNDMLIDEQVEFETSEITTHQCSNGDPAATSI